MVININVDSSAGFDTDKFETCSYACDEPQSYDCKKAAWPPKASNEQK